MVVCVTDGGRREGGGWWDLWAEERTEKGDAGAWPRCWLSRGERLSPVGPRGEVGVGRVLGLRAVMGTGCIPGELEGRWGAQEDREGVL